MVEQMHQKLNYFEAIEGKLNGGIGIEPFDPADPKTTPHIIRTSHPLDLKVVWAVYGDFAPYLGGRWELRLTCKNVDGVGVSEGRIDKATVDLATVPASVNRQYSHMFRVLPGQIEPGVYQFTVVLGYTNAGYPGAISGFAETGPIEFYKATD